MKNVTRALCTLIVLLTAGCSTDSAKTITYETLQNMGQQQCEKSLSPDCPKRESYDDYQRKRKELVPVPQ